MKALLPCFFRKGFARLKKEKGGIDYRVRLRAAIAICRPSWEGREKEGNKKKEKRGKKELIDSFLAPSRAPGWEKRKKKKGGAFAFTYLSCPGRRKRKKRGGKEERGKKK